MKKTAKTSVVNDTNVDIILNQVICIRKELETMNRHIRGSNKKIYTNQEVMELLDIGTKTLKKWRDSGEIGFSCKGNMYFYTWQDISDFLARNYFEAFAPIS